MPTYPLTADRVLSLGVSHDVLIDGGGAFLETRRALVLDGRPKKSWELLHDHITLTEWQTLLSFFEARVGRWESFSFTDPETLGVHTVRFDTDVLRADKPLGREENPLFVVQVRIKETL